MAQSRSPLASVLAAALGLAACNRKPEGPNILLVTLDTTRRDHLGCYGYPLPTSPGLDRLAADSVVYTNAYAVSSWTLPTHASLFTGKLPTAHGAQYDENGPIALSEGIAGDWGHYRARPIAAEEITLAALLADHGYATGGVAGGPWMKRVFQLDRGFEFYDDANITALNGRSAEDVTRVALEFVDEHADEPFFLFLNYYDPHSPWWEEPEADGAGNWLAPPRPLRDVRPVFPPGLDPAQVDILAFSKVCYDAEIRYMDEHLGRLLERLRATGLYERTWIIVTADHGELIGEPVLGETELWGHGNSLTQPEIHIPLIVKEAGPPARRGPDASPVQQIDVLPTILERLGLPLPGGIQGTPLGRAGHPIVAELHTLPFMSGGVSRADRPKPVWHKGDWRVLVDGPFKFGWSSNGTHFLVDLAGDPLERANLLEADPARARAMEKELSSYLAGLPRPGAVGAVEELDDETKKALKQLGYGGDEEHAPPEEAEVPSPPSGRGE